MVKGCKMDDEKQAPGVLDNLLFPKIFRTFRIAIQPTKLIIALVGIAIISLAGWLMDLNKTVVVTRNAEGMVTRSELDVYVDSPDMFQSYVETHEDARQAGVFSTLWHFDRQRFHDALYSLFSFKLPDVAGNIGECFKAVGWAFRHHLGYCIILVVIKLAVISIAGGAICRIAALQFAQGEKPGPTEALRFSTSKFLSFFTAPLLPIAFIAVAGLCVLLLAVIGNIPFFGDVVMALFMFLALRRSGDRRRGGIQPDVPGRSIRRLRLFRCDEPVVQLRIFETVEDALLQCGSNSLWGNLLRICSLFRLLADAGYIRLFGHRDCRSG
jgi:hypothetical protein